MVKPRECYRIKIVFKILSNVQTDKNRELSTERVYTRESETGENQTITVINRISNVIYTKEK